MAKITDETDNFVDVGRVISQTDLNEIFTLADEIYNIKIKYDEDPPKMANDAIHDMKMYACKIAGIVDYRD